MSGDALALFGLFLGVAGATFMVVGLWALSGPLERIGRVSAGKHMTAIPVAMGVCAVILAVLS